MPFLSPSYLFANGIPFLITFLPYIIFYSLCIQPFLHAFLNTSFSISFWFKNVPSEQLLNFILVFSPLSDIAVLYSPLDFAPPLIQLATIQPNHAVPQKYPCKLSIIQ